MKVLVLCTGNSCRSQMAEGFLRTLAYDRFEVASAGIESHGLNMDAVAVMMEAGIDILHHRSKLVDEFLGTGVTHVITVCDDAAEKCPHFPEDVIFTHYSFPDPAKFVGDEEDRKIAFRDVRSAIGAAMFKWIADHCRSGS